MISELHRLSLRHVAQPPSDQDVDVPGTNWYGRWKKAADPGLAIVLLVLTSPLILLSIVLIKLTSRGPAIYTQVRLGLHGRRYTIFKIRTMAQDCERTTGPQWATLRDPRVTPVGRFLRRTHLDELPQLWNVVRGEMSLVGPRPERPEFATQLVRVLPRYGDRLAVLPGLTGLAQVQLAPDTDVASVRRKLACDLYYVHRISPWLDLRILLSTVTHVLGVPFAVPRALLGMPSGNVVESAYKSLRTDVMRVPQLQSA